MADLDADYRKILKDTFDEKKSRNKSYSLRSFARLLGIDNGFLSKLMRGQVLLSLDTADQITQKLKMSHEQRRLFIQSAAEEQQCHALYLLDPSLTDCDPEKAETNLNPKR